VTHRPISVEYKSLEIILPVLPVEDIYIGIQNIRRHFQMPTLDPSWEPEGPLVAPAPSILPSIDSVIDGQHVSLIPLLESHAAELYNNVAGLQNAHLYKYLFGGPFSDVESFVSYIKLLCREPTGFLPYAIRSKSPVASSSTAPPPHSPGEKRSGNLTGIICLLNIVPSHRSIEIGHVLFGPLLQRSTAATEACYILMKHCFEDLNYLRVEWKANNFNEPSKRAALRLGFVFEGIFRKHMVVRGRGRDTAWYGVTDEEWAGVVKAALEDWLRDDNFDGQRRQRTRLEEVRKGIVGGSAR
jgi:RimJ/RimL family protein N-acetyltransferase